MKITIHKDIEIERAWFVKAFLLASRQAEEMMDAVKDDEQKEYWQNAAKEYDRVYCKLLIDSDIPLFVDITEGEDGRRLNYCKKCNTSGTPPRLKEK